VEVPADRCARDRGYFDVIPCSASSAAERRFVVEKKLIMRELDSEPAHPNLVAGAEMSVIAFFGDILRRMDRRRAAKKRAKDSSGK
jgi:hypothetical protein